MIEALVYLIVIAAAEVITVTIQPMVGLVLHIVVLVVIIVLIAPSLVVFLRAQMEAVHG